MSTPENTPKEAKMSNFRALPAERRAELMGAYVGRLIMQPSSKRADLFEALGACQDLDQRAAAEAAEGVKTFVKTVESMFVESEGENA